MPEKYKKPPIVEAVVEVKFSPPLSDKLLRRWIDAVAPRYARREDQIEVELTLHVEKSRQQINQRFSGARLLTEDGADIVIVSKDSLSVTRLAPYTGWTALQELVLREVEEFRKLASDRTLTRLGVRYINRIDVPTTDGTFTPDPYLTLLPTRPEILAQGAAQGFSVSLVGCAVGDYMVNVNMGIAPPQLIDHAALLVDVDAYREAEMDSRDLGDILNGVRDVKNSVFESLITDQSRALFHD